MTDWDHRDAFALVIGDPAEGQQAEGGYNKDNNCVPTTEALFALLYGGPDISPQDITTRTYGVSFHGGEDYGATIITLRSMWPECPAISYPGGHDVLAVIDPEASQRYGIACSFHCDGWGNIQTHTTGILHVSPVMAHVAGQVHILNVERDTEIVLSEADFAAATSGQAGQLMVFQQPLPGGDWLDAQHTQQLLQWVAFRQYVDALIRPPESVDAMVARANRIADIGAISSQWEIEQGKEGLAKPGGLLGVIAGAVARLAAVEAHLSKLGTEELSEFDVTAVQAQVDRARAELAEAHKALAADHKAMLAAAATA